jgi:hypothetical protein
MVKTKFVQRFPAHEDPALSAQLYQTGPGSGTLNWTWAMRYVFSALADPERARFPERPAAGVDRTSSPSLGYWTALQGYMTYVLGWRRHDLGLQWWLAEGREHGHHPRLDLLRSVWDHDGALDNYLAWAMAAPGGQNPTSIYPKQDAASSVPPDSRWNRWLADNKHLLLSSWGPFGLHLEMGDHLKEIEQDPVGAHRWYAEPEAERAVLEVESFGNAFRVLREGLGLPARFRPTWRVRVFAHDVGYLGEYRRSWESGLWFSGPHRYHARGI